MSDNCQKIKLLRLMELLQRETDENHPMTTQEIQRRLSEMGTSCDRRTLAEDVQALREAGYELMDTRVGHQNAYYFEDRSFSLPELKVLIDAAQAAAFIPDADTRRLVQKIAQLAGDHQAELLMENAAQFNTRKHSNPDIYRNIDIVRQAIREEKKLTFRYFDLNENHERVYRKPHGNEIYRLDPVALVYNEDYYYLITFAPSNRKQYNYRLDRMDNPAVDPEPIHIDSKGYRDHSDIGVYTAQVFKMFGGEPHQIRLTFQSSLISTVYDKFGENIVIRRDDAEWCSTTVDVIVSPNFYGWVFQFDGKMIIDSPPAVIKRYHELTGQLLSVYEQE